MAWRTILTDLAGTALSELPMALAKNVAVPLSSFATAGATVRLDHVDADTLLQADTLLKVYEDIEQGPYAGARVYHFAGRQVTGEEVADENGGTVAATWADPFWVLMRRLCGKSKAGYVKGDALTLFDRGAIITELVNATNAESPTPLRMGTVAASSSTYVTGWWYKRIGEGIAELGATLDGPDWRVTPIEPVLAANGLAIIGELGVAPVWGGVKPDTVFEYGDGAMNVRAYQRGVTLDGTLNRAFHLPPGFPDNATQDVLTAQDPVSQATRGLLEDTITGDLSVDTLRQQLLAHTIAVRANPRQTITFDLVRDLGGRVPHFGIDYSVGDVVPFRASYTRVGVLQKRINALFRVYQFAAAIDNNGVATPAVTVTPS